MRCERHGLALGPEDTCVLCLKMRSAQSPGTSARPASRSSVVPLLLILALLAGGGAILWRYALASQTDLDAFLPGTTGTLWTKNSAGRSGAYFLPSGYNGRPLPLLVAIHGTNLGSGEAMVRFFREAAEREKFIVVAPDSRLAPDGKDSWEVGDHAGEITPDLLHVRACVAELLAMPGVRLDPTHVLIAGHSGGGSTAPYVATNGGAVHGVRQCSMVAYLRAGWDRGP